MSAGLKVAPVGAALKVVAECAVDETPRASPMARSTVETDTDNWQRKSPSSRDGSQDSVDEGTPGPSGLSFEAESGPRSSVGSSFEVVTKPKEVRRVYHERSGLWVQPLSTVGRDAAADMYVRLQRDGHIFKKLGLQGEELRRYAEFHVDIARKEPWNVCAVDDEGKVQGLVCFIRRADEVDASSLPPIARDHWEIFLSLEREFRERGKVDTSPYLCCTFLGMMPEHQGKGLYGIMNFWQADAASEHGFTHYWSWTLNPNVLKAIGKGDGAISFATRLGELFFAAPPWVTNNMIIPTLSVLGLLPAELRAFWVPLESLGIKRMIGITRGLNPLVSANIMITTELKQRRKEIQKQVNGRAHARLLRVVAMLVLAISMLVAARQRLIR